MSDCCSSTHSPQKQPCPSDGKMCSQVSKMTILHHIKAPWQWRENDQTYYFCSNPECDVVYFAEDGSVFNSSALRTAVGIKEQLPDSLVCYCFGVTIKESFKPEIKNFVLQKTREKSCDCEIRNPSGKCCLKDFPKL